MCKHSTLTVWLATSLFLAADACAQDTGMRPEIRWKVGAWAGFAGAKMGDMEDDALRGAKESGDSFLSYLVSTGSSGLAISTSDERGSGVGLGVEVGYLVTGHFGLGIRMGIVTPSDISYSVSGTGTANETYSDSVAISMSLTPVMFGWWVEVGERVGVNYRFTVFLGPASGKVELSRLRSLKDPSLGDQNIATNIPYSGNTVAFEVGGQIGYGISETFSVYSELSFRQARIESMKADQNIDVDGDGSHDVIKGEAYSNSDGQPPELDFKGLNLNLGVRLSF